MTVNSTTRGSDWGIVFCLLMAAFLLFGIDLDGVPLRDWDEGTVAQVAREISRSDRWTGWVFPQLWDAPYLNKPPLLHGLIALAYQQWGVQAWTARLPGALLTALSVPGLFLIGREIFPSRVPALMGSLVYLTLLPVVRHGRLAMLDGAVVFFFLVTLWMLLRALRRPSPSSRASGQPSVGWYLGMGMGGALMCLTKGILGILLLAIALLFLAWEAPKHLMSLRLWSGLGLGLLPAGVWYGLQGYHYGGQFVDTALVSQGINRIWTTVEQHQHPAWYYLLELLKYSWPWLIFWPTGVSLTWRFRRHRWAKLLLVWTGGYLLAISIMGTKLPWYIFPLYPAIALVCGVALAAAWDRHRHWNGRSLSLKRLPKLWGILLCLVSGVGAVGVVYASPWGGEPSWALALTFLSIALAAGLSAFWVFRQQLRFIPVLVVGIYGALLSLVVSDHWVWELGEAYPVLPVAQLVQQHTSPGQVIYTSFPYERPALNFYSDRRVRPDAAAALQDQWQSEQPSYLLVEDPTPYTLEETQGKTLGTTTGWHLLRNQP